MKIMKRILLSTMLAGAMLLPAATMASAAQRAGGHGVHAQARVAPRVFVGRPAFPGRVIVRPYGYWRPYGYYDPFWYDWGYPYAYGRPEALTGGLRLEVKPEKAQVFVDGGYAGVVDDFDGHFQHLDLVPGSHTIEVRAPGFQPLTFTTYIQPDHTTDYKAALVPVQ